MATVSGIHRGKRAWALAAALLLGTAILGFPSAQPAYAVATTPGAGDADTGDQGSEPTSRKPKPKPKPKDGENLCSLTRQDGTVEFHEWGAYVSVNGRMFYCTASGHWMEVKRAAVPSESTAPGGGDYTQAP